MRRYPVPALLLALSACTTAPPPATAPAPQPSPPPVSKPPSPPVAWQDAPLAPGQWRYVADGAGSSARFGEGLAQLRCDRVARTLSLSGAPGVGQASPLKVTTSFGTRSVAGPLPATDGLFDQIVFSRGRFLIEAPGAAPLVLPAWPELARVVEDCRS